MSIEIKQNFDWSATDKKLVIFMPNYNGKYLTEASIQRIQTAVDYQHWMILIGNDNVDDNWDHLRTNNVASITLLRDDKQPRNGAFIRNYVIKRCRSEYLLQKDGEVCIEGDFIHNAIEQCSGDLGWRPGYAVALNQVQTLEYLAGCNSALDPICHEIEPVRPCVDVNLVKEYLLRRNGQVNFISYYHYAYCVRTKLLQDVRGYDEEYRHYGWEDVDMYLRLGALGIEIKPDYNCYAVHLNHRSTVNHDMLNVMASVFRSKSPVVTHRNDNGWGEGE